VNFGINGTTELQSKGETAQTNSGTKPSGATNEQAFLIEQAAEATRTLDKSLTQEGIFNRLTNNGEVQGLILYNGKVYLNAEYIQAGTIAANLLMAAILTIGGANNGNGQIKILDANGNVIGTWDKNGISVTKGSITGGTINGATLTLGGNNNASGTLTVKDASNNTVGTWDKGGINIFYGALSISYIRQYYDDTYYFGQNGFVAKRVANKGLSTEHTSTISISGEAIDINKQGSGASIPEININSTHDDDLYEMGISPYEGIDWKVAGNRFIYVTPHSTGVGKGVILYTDFIVASGNTKSKVVSTDQYSDRLLYCYETPSPLYGDVGEGVIGDDGLCYVTIDPIFAQTIMTDNYQVFLQRYGAGDCYVQKRKGGWFVVAGTPGLAFGWEIKGKQADIANVDIRRLDRNDEPFTVPKQTFGEDAAKHIEDIRKERESA